MAAEVARRHTAEMRVAALEATNDTRAAMEQKAAAPTPDIRPRRERKTKAA